MKTPPPRWNTELQNSNQIYQGTALDKMNGSIAKQVIIALRFDHKLNRFELPNFAIDLEYYILN